MKVELSETQWWLRARSVLQVLRVLAQKASTSHGRWLP